MSEHDYRRALAAFKNGGPYSKEADAAIEAALQLAIDSTGGEERRMTEHETIFLQPACGDYVCQDGREWSWDNPWDPCSDCGATAVEFIRTDIAASIAHKALAEAAAEMVAATEAANAFWEDGSPDDRDEDGYSERVHGRLRAAHEGLRAFLEKHGGGDD